MNKNLQILDRVILALPSLEVRKTDIANMLSEDNSVSLFDILYNQIGNQNQFSEFDLRKAIASATNVKPLDQLPENTLKLTLKYLPLEFAKSQQVVIFNEDNEKIYVATAQPANREVIQTLLKKFRRPIDLYFVFSYQIIESLKENQVDFNEQVKNLQSGALDDLQSLESLKNSSQLLDMILIRSLNRSASDIHIEPHGERVLIRFRIDGELQDVAELPYDLAEVITSRIKVLAEMRIDEHMKPQDGRFKLDLSDGSEITTRVSVLPVYQGEKVVMRILSEKNQKVDLNTLGYTEKNQSIIYSNAEKAHGMLLVTGPTGSGKTTTLYTLLKLLNRPDLNLMTVEDPIEYRLDRVNQVQVNSTAGLTFAGGLRSILRQDPDVVMIGEIRDEETATIAVNASLTGHLVLATLHTNSAIDTLPRLSEMGVENYLVASTVNVVIAQRLLRKLCDSCRKGIIVDEAYLSNVQKEGTGFEVKLAELIEITIGLNGTIYEPQGCDKCNQTGYKGRLAIAEVLEVDEDIQEQIFKKASTQEIMERAKEKGFTELIDDAILKVKSGSTSITELIRVLKD